jgi:hypothetical protein
MAELVFDPNEYLRQMAPKGGISTSFQEGQKAAADISAAQTQQRLYQQQMDIAEATLPYKMAGLERERQAGDIELQNFQRRQAALQEYARGGTSLELPGQLKPPVGAGYMAPVEPSAGGATPTTTDPFGPYKVVGTRPSASLIANESGNNLGAINQFGYAGALQIGADRLQDAVRAGVVPQGVTPQMLASNTDLQQRVNAWHISDINNYITQRGLGKYIGSTVGGVPVTQEGMIAVANLGGKAGLEKYLATGGQYNPADANQTRLSDYMARHGGAAAPSGISGFRRDLTIGGLAETVGAGTSGILGNIGLPVVKLGNYFFGSPETGAKLDQMVSGRIAAKNWYNSAAVTDALTKRPELLQEAQQNPLAFYQKYSSAIQPSEQTSATQAGMPDMLSPTPMGGAPAGLREPSASSAITSVFEAKPGVPAPAPAAMTYLRNPPKLNGDMQVVVAQDRELDRLQKFYAQSGEIAQAAETGLKRIQLRNTYQNLQGLQSITNFDLGDNISLSNAMSRATGRQIGIQPLTNGNFNLVVGGQTLRSNISRADLKDAAQYMLSESYRAQSMEMQKKQFDLQVELTKERAKAGYKVQEKQYEKLYEGITKLQVERLKLSGMKVVEGEDGKFFVYKPDGSYAAYVDPQGQIVMPDGTKLDNPSVTSIPLMIPMTSTR